MNTETRWYMHLVNAEGSLNRRLAEMLMTGIAAQHNGTVETAEVDDEPTLIVDVCPAPTGDGHGPAGITGWSEETIEFRVDMVEIVEAFEPGFTEAYEAGRVSGPMVWRPTDSDDLVFLVGVI